MMFAKAYMQIFGDLETMTRMSEQFMRAASLGTAADGLMRTLPPQAQEMLERVASSVGMALRPADEPHAGNGNGTSAPPPPQSAPPPPIVVDAESVHESKPGKRASRDDR